MVTILGWAHNFKCGSVSTHMKGIVALKLKVRKFTDLTKIKYFSKHVKLWCKSPYPRYHFCRANFGLCDYILQKSHWLPTVQGVQYLPKIHLILMKLL